MTASEELQARIASALENAFARSDKTLLASCRPEWTNCWKRALEDLGHELGFEVCASGCQRAEEGEWLYDMSWYTLDRSKGGTLVAQPMVLESEWSPDPTVDGDFQKLVQARADVRVWIFTAADFDAVESYIGRCRDQAKSFVGTQRGDRYVCAGYDWRDKRLTVRVFAIGA